MVFINGLFNTSLNNHMHSDGKECKVNDPDIAKHYEGGCKNGLAHGEGLARGRDEYKGSFRNGSPHGFGVYKWGKNSDWATEIYEGSWYKGDKTGFGTVSVSANSSAPGIRWVTEQGQLVGKRYVHQLKNRLPSNE